jgi:hypothetical protein
VLRALHPVAKCVRHAECEGCIINFGDVVQNFGYFFSSILCAHPCHELAQKILASFFFAQSRVACQCGKHFASPISKR